MKYTLNAGEWNSVFAVPSGVVDRYIKLASGNSLKLLLFLLRHGGDVYSDEVLKTELGFTSEGELEDAALFWIQRGVIRYDAEKTTDDSNALSPASKKPASLGSEQVTLDDIGSSGAAVPIEHSAGNSAKKVSGSIYYSSGDIGSRIKTDGQIRFLFEQAEQLYGHTLKSKENQVIISLVDTFGLPAMVALMLLKHCFGAGKTTPSYIQSVAKSWHDDEIFTVEQADQRIAAMERISGAEEKIRTAMDLKTRLTAKQRDFIRVWTEEWGFDTDMIMLAYEITVDKTGEASFPYMNSILNSWSASGIHTKEGAEQLSAAHRHSAKSTDNTSIDMDGIMAELIGQYNK